MTTRRLPDIEKETVAGLRRLPKSLDTADQDRAAQNETSTTRFPRFASEALYFAPLRDPLTDAASGGRSSIVPSPLNEEEHESDLTPAVPWDHPMASSATIDPAAYLRHSRRSDGVSESPVSPASIPAQHPAERRQSSTGERMQAALAQVMLASEHRDQLPAGAQQHAIEGAPPADPEYLEDPRPASTRPSRVSRSRPSKPSGSYRKSRSYDEVPADRTPSPVKPDVEPSPAPPVVDPSRSGAPRLKTASAMYASAPVATVPQKSVATDETPSGSSAVSPVPGKATSIAGMAVFSVLLVLYAFEIGPLESAVDAAVGHLLSGGAGSTAAQTFAVFLPWLLVVPALALLGGVIWFLMAIIGVRRPKTRTEKRRKAKAVQLPMTRFKADADKRGIESRTAYRTWRLLEAACQGERDIHVHSSLTQDLLLAPKDIRSVHLRLLKELSRVHDPAMRLPNTETVLDLMAAAEDAPLQRPDRKAADVIVPGDPGRRKR